MGIGTGRHTLFFAFGLLTGLLILGGCAATSGVSSNKSAESGQGGVSKAEKSFTQFPDIPVPTRSDMDVERTLVFGSDGGWFGRLVMTSRHGVSAAFDFYKQEMPGFGWEAVTMVRSAQSVLTYSREGRIATIQISDATLTGSDISITVSPRQSSAKPAPLVTDRP
ncbi:hypothetical protein JCM17960_08750 [Magnetospira thiophila]